MLIEPEDIPYLGQQLLLERLRFRQLFYIELTSKLIESSRSLSENEISGSLSPA